MIIEQSLQNIACPNILISIPSHGLFYSLYLSCLQEISTTILASTTDDTYFSHGDSFIISFITENETTKLLIS